MGVGAEPIHMVGAHSPLSPRLAFPAVVRRYCFALTAERGPEIHFQKIRILMIKELTLARWAERPRESPSRYPLHRLRWRTLARFAELYREQRQRELATPSGKLGYSDAHHWIRIQVRIPVAHGEGTAGRLPVGQALVNAPA